MFGAIVAQAHTVRVNGGYSWRRGRENCTLDFSLLSEFVYMWKTLHCFSTEEIVIQSFITFELIQVVLFWTHCYFLIQLNNGFLLRLNVMSWHLSADSVFHIRLFLFVSSFSSGFSSVCYSISVLFTYSFQLLACVTNSSSSCSLLSEERGACTSATLL